MVDSSGEKPERGQNPSECADAFIRRNTRLQQPPLVPEVSLYLADDLMRLWENLGADAGNEHLGIPFWGCAWVGGQALARYVLDHPEEVEGRHVLDLATGSGLCAIAAVKAGAASVTAVDIDPLAACAARMNGAANNCTLDVIQKDVISSAPLAVDVILAGDVCYEEEMAAQFLPWLHQAHQRGVRVLMGDPGRHYFPRETTTLLETYDVPTTWEVEGAETKRTSVYTAAGPNDVFGSCAQNLAPDRRTPRSTRRAGK